MRKFLKAYLFSSLCLLFLAAWYLRPKEQVQEELRPKGNLVEQKIPSLQMFYYLDKYSTEYKVPMQIAMGIANSETGYLGPFHWTYKHDQTSHKGAEGPMQIMPSTAAMLLKRKVSRHELREDIELNVRVSMQLMSHLYRTYGNWTLALGAYNTGKPVSNNYAREIILRSKQKVSRIKRT